MFGMSPIALSVAAVVVIAVVYFLSKKFGQPKVEMITCPNCNKTMEKGRRFCPFCKEKLTNY
jgi:predicted amidophosphoribosyltransferase